MLPYFDMIIKIVGIQNIGRDTIFMFEIKTVTQKYLFILFIIFAKTNSWKSFYALMQFVCNNERNLVEPGQIAES